MALRKTLALFVCLEMLLFDLLLLVVVLGGVVSLAVRDFLMPRVRADLNWPSQVPLTFFGLLADQPVCELGVHVGVVANGDLH